MKGSAGKRNAGETNISKINEEPTVPLHKVFLDLSLENDLKGEELEWFKSKISLQKVQNKKKEKPDREIKRVEILTEYELENVAEKPKKLLLRLTETNTIWLLSLETCFSQDNAEDAERVRRENEAYEKKKTKKEIIRKRCTADTQTPCYMVKCKETLTSEIVMKDALIFASEWDMYDTYNAFGKLEKTSSGKYLNFEDPIKTITSDAVFPTEEEITKTFGSLPFKYASLVMERLLASNCFQSKQSVFKKDYRTRYDTGPTQFTYKIELLWSFQKEFEHPLAVSDMDWNPLNEDLLAVSYGDLNFEKKSSGLVCIWSSKNPRQPERQFEFQDSVTTLHYSRSRPNLLAVGTRKGKVYILDVSAQQGNIRILGRDDIRTYSGPVWKVEWFLHKELVSKTEELLAIGENGVLKVFSSSNDKDTKDILKLDYITCTQKLPEKVASKNLCRRASFQNEIFNRKTFSGLSFSIYSSRDFCYISTKEGVVVKCNLRNASMTDGVYLAHDGPVYTIQHSPATDLIYLTCGADWKIKIWMEGITQPLITLQQKAPVACARWSPTIPTLIASVGESNLFLWNIGRNILSPMSTQTFENCEKPLSTLLFSSNGGSSSTFVVKVLVFEASHQLSYRDVFIRTQLLNIIETSSNQTVQYLWNMAGGNLMVGCELGLVRVIHLSELPRIPFLQKEALISAVRRALLRNENKLLGEFCREVEANKDQLKTKVLEHLK